jgi:hypothetical protein
MTAIGDFVALALAVLAVLATNVSDIAETTKPPASSRDQRCRIFMIFASPRTTAPPYKCGIRCQLLFRFRNRLHHPGSGRQASEDLRTQPRRADRLHRGRVTRARSGDCLAVPDHCVRLAVPDHCVRGAWREKLARSVIALHSTSKLPTCGSAPSFYFPPTHRSGEEDSRSSP